MIKYVLILHLCSFISEPICTSQTILPYEYQEFHDCIKQGYIFSYQSLMEIDKNEINKDRLAIKFECRTIEVPEVSS